jgi:cytochrome c-type biogenesis protein CcmE
MAAGLKKRRRIQLVAIVAVMLALSTALIGYGMRDGIEFFRSPSQLAGDPPNGDKRFRLGGLVVEGSVQRGNGPEVFFTVTDGGASLPVVFAGILPDLFREGQGVIATGTLADGVFVANEVLARHDESYMPREVAEALEEQGLLRYGEGIAKPPGS